MSKLFLDIIKNNIEIDIIAAPTTEREFLEWSINFVDERHLEDTYVGYIISDAKFPGVSVNKKKNREKHLRQRFRFYLQRFLLYLSPCTSCSYNAI